MLQVCPSAEDAAKPQAASQGPSQNYWTPPKRRRSHKGADASQGNAMKAADEALRKECAEDFWLTPAMCRPPPVEMLSQRLACGGQAEICKDALAKVKERKSVQTLLVENKDAWTQRLEKGFSLLFQGIGSKFRLLEAFAQVLFRSGIPIATFEAFTKGTSLAAFLRELLALHDWKSAGSLPRLCTALLEARRAAGKTPLALIVHNLEALPRAHLSALASLAAAKEIWLVASVDSIYADLFCEIDSYPAKEFTFSYEEVHTMESYQVELKGKYPDGLPWWAHPLARKKQAKVSLGLVLRCLTDHQRELVQEMAKDQLSRGGQQGMPWEELVALAADLLIATSHTRLRRLLKELTDHQILIERQGRFELAVKEAALRKLAEGEPVDDVDVEDGDDENDAGDEDASEASDDVDDDE